MDWNHKLTRRIVELAALPEHEIELAKAALLIARSEYPFLDESRYLGLLDSMADRLKTRISGACSDEERIAQINELLFTEEGFRGNREEYYDPRNSFLNQVLDRKLGIPITLCLVYMEVGRRAGLPVYGIGFPGHFLAGYLANKRRIFIDPFNRGEILTEEACRRMLHPGAGDRSVLPAGALDPSWPKHILVRIMRNLKAICRYRNEELKAQMLTHWIITLHPEAVPELVERGLFYEAIGDSYSAVRDLQKYLDLFPFADDAESIRTKVERLKQGPELVN